MFGPPDAVQPQLPALEAGFSPEELEELLSLINPAPSSTVSGSEGSIRTTDSSSVDEIRKRKRKISNRESARRSRWRKKQHLEDLTEQMNRFAVENQELKCRLHVVMNQCHVARKENELLRSECIYLLARLSDLYQILVNMQSIQ